jgi:hypothetical protein
LRFLGFNVEFDGLSSQFFGLFIEQQHTRDILFSAHSFTFDEFHVAFVVVVLFVSEERVLNEDDVVDVHVGVAVDVKTE